MRRTVISLQVRQQQDMVLARQRARYVAAMLGFDAQDQTRLATAVSEIARNALQYASGARVEFALEDGDPPLFWVVIRDRGPGIKNLQGVLDGNFAAPPGKGLGLAGVRRLMDRFHVESSDGGTTVTFGKTAPKRLGHSFNVDIAHIAEELAKKGPQDPFEELREQNREMLRTLEELRQRQAELAAAHQELKRREVALSELNRELEDTNRGVVALYAELEEKADFLSRASEMKSRFLSNMSHEFRTPLNSVMGLTRLLLDRTDGDLTAEQETQVTLIRRATENLTELVNDLLDLAKVEAGKVIVRATDFDLASLFGGLRGMLRPLLAANSSVELIFEEPTDFPPLHTDESKVSQILRNFISNALKFTERGEVRVLARLGADDTVTLSVSDTGVGIAPSDQVRIFEEFTQVEGAHQKRVRGTGLGLPLVKKLTQLLGGHVRLQSALGQGSTFSATLPRVYRGPAELHYVPEVSLKIDPSRKPVLVVEDNREALFIYEKYLKGAGYQVLPAKDLPAARHALTQFRPYAIILDVLLEHETGWELLVELKQSEALRSIPVFIVTLVENEQKALALGADGYCVKPVDRDWLLRNLGAAGRSPERPCVLVIDDDDIARYLIRDSLKAYPVTIVEAASAQEGIQFLREKKPSLVVLDYELPDRTGLEVVDGLRTDAHTAALPIVVNTSKVLTPEERSRLQKAGVLSILSKEHLASPEGRSELHAILRTMGIEP